MTIEEKLSEILSARELRALQQSPVLTCQRCSHEWARRPIRVDGQLVMAKLPDRCPECNSPGWAYPVQAPLKSEGAREYQAMLRKQRKAEERSKRRELALKGA